MAKSYWMVIKGPENYSIAQERGFDMVGMVAQHKRKALRMSPGDRVLIYVSRWRRFAAAATVTSGLKIDNTPIWNQEGGSDFPYRVGIKPDVTLPPERQIDAYQIAPRMDFTKRWIPELWHLAFQGSLHLISKLDFTLIEGEMKKQARGAGQARAVFASSIRPSLQLATRCKLEEIRPASA